MRRALEATRLAVLTDLGESLAALGAIEESIAVHREVIDAEPVREDVHRLLMERYGHADCGVYAEVVAGGEIAVGNAVA